MSHRIPLWLLLAGAGALFLTTRLPVVAATAELDVQPRAVTIGEAAICSVTIRGLDNPAPPTLLSVPGLQISPVGTERSWSMGRNGQDSSVSFRYQILPLQAGRFSIGPVSYPAAGETLEIPAVELHVVEPAATAPPAPGQPQIADLLFATISAQPTNVYIQQVFDVVLSIYSRNINLGRDLELGNLPASGLSLPPFQEIGATREVVNNQIYDVRRFRCKAQALTTGAFKLEPNIRVQVLVPRDRRRRSPLDGIFDDAFFPDSFFSRVQAQPVDLRATPIELTVRPLPPAEGVAGFAGAVGRFAFDVQVRPTEVQAGDPVTLSMQISGEGNIENVSPPAL
ncbi:MAG: BatD family protein, partial [Verrucomicrobia bacterium]|nr:BatD family protein [Verrucomicrobiota bacterium]